MSSSKNKFKTGLVYLFLLKAFSLFSQSDSLYSIKPEIAISGFADAYYAYDFNEPRTSYRLPFLVNHNRHNEFNINLALIKFSATHSKYRANVALQTGNYATDNFATEPNAFKYINECNVGLSLNKKNNLWLDVGVLNSHIGFESAVSIDNWNLTRSLLAELSPYYITGAKLIYYPNSKLELSALVCNGWQRIKKVPFNSMLSFGTQIKYTPTEKLLFNWSTFIGTDDADAVRRMRYFSNVYTQIAVTDKLGIMGGFDCGVQEKAKKSIYYDYWYSPVIIARYKIKNNLFAALRYEYYEDKKGVIVPLASMGGNEFVTSGYSINFDYNPISTVACRIEGRLLSSTEDIYFRTNNFVASNFFVTASVAIKFGKYM